MLHPKASYPPRLHRLLTLAPPPPEPRQPPPPGASRPYLQALARIRAYAPKLPPLPPLPPTPASLRFLARNKVPTPTCQACGAPSMTPVCTSCNVQVPLVEGYSMLRSSAHPTPDGQFSRYEYRLGAYHANRLRDANVRLHRPPAGDPLARDPFRLGAEWEMHVQDRNAIGFEIDATGFAVAEEDASLEMQDPESGDYTEAYGLEAITGWSSLTLLRTWLVRLHGLVDPDIISLEDCGLHVSLSGLSPPALARFVTFWSLPANKQAIRVITGRWNTEYARREGDPKLAAAWRRYVKCRGTWEKYRHVHVRNGYVEVRCFKSTANLQHLLARVEFTWATAHFAASGSSHLDFGAFLAWFASTPWTEPHCRNLIQAFPSIFGPSKPPKPPGEPLAKPARARQSA